MISSYLLASAHKVEGLSNPAQRAYWATVHARLLELVPGSREERDFYHLANAGEPPSPGDSP